MSGTPGDPLEGLPFSRSRAVERFEEEMFGPKRLESLAEQARAETRKNFGRTMRLFAPLYLSNECVNTCRYCGFSKDNPIRRVTLTPEEVEGEARHLAGLGFRNVLLVSGEHPREVPVSYLVETVRRSARLFPSVAIEVAPLETAEYRDIVEAGAEGLVLYQESYDRAAYAEMHVSGPKRNFDERLGGPERGYQAGFRRIGLGVLVGLADWRRELVALAAHVSHLMKVGWKAQITLALPRLRPAAGGFQPRVGMSDRDFVRAICAFRVAFPQVGIVLSTREPAKLRNGLMDLGVTMMSAGSETDPGGYTGAGRERLHRTVRGREVALEANEEEGAEATEQFEVSDERSPEELSRELRRRGIDPVWKDWDQALAG
ncbi:MAG: 2-iminoacetate synthase ThiH [Verrucomicrobia bacterium]|nr:2-iminoacetate synthase ThiH [Pseudomonadota bacterium]NBS07229.1 2-iminoacetate synthase ThiH [Verrucomicrobiota bacterium]NBS49924.1 2-iminoacetate synthase ThiH [Verrucomicrobiota bacterium]NBS78519.1 2-iminoacetate synthase ThiH [bacterium]NBY66054.1 2-iminoacetate synthase ThiH [Verrucomicrobiota bacterium]